MFYITGDTHGDQRRIPFIEEQVKFRPEDYLFRCGVFGFLFRNNEEENAFLDELSERWQHTICFIDGNHENFPAIYAYPEEVWNGGRIHRIRKNIIHLMRGQVFTIEGKKFFTFGGAYSLDRFLRKVNISYWEEEIPNEAEYREGMENLFKHDYRVDYILSHTASTGMIEAIGFKPKGLDMELMEYLQGVYERTTFDKWFFGHLHKDIVIDERVRGLYFEMVGIENE